MEENGILILSSSLEVGGGAFSLALLSFYF